MITIYIHGCSSCGVDAVYIRRIKKWANDNDESVDIINSKYDEARRREHLGYASQLSSTADFYTPVVVHSDKVLKLREWSI